MRGGLYRGVMPRQGPWARLLALFVALGMTLASVAPSTLPQVAPRQGLEQALSLICSARSAAKPDSVPAAPRPAGHPASQSHCGLCPACPGALADTGQALDAAVLRPLLAGPVIVAALQNSFPLQWHRGAERPPVRGPPA